VRSVFVQQTIGELQRSINAAKQRLKKITSHKMCLEQRMKDNEKELCRVKADLKTELGQVDQPPQVIADVFVVKIISVLIFTVAL